MFKDPNFSKELENFVILYGGIYDKENQNIIIESDKLHEIMQEIQSLKEEKRLDEEIYDKSFSALYKDINNIIFCYQKPEDEERKALLIEEAKIREENEKLDKRLKSEKEELNLLYGKLKYSKEQEETYKSLQPKYDLKIKETDEKLSLALKKLADLKKIISIDREKLNEYQMEKGFVKADIKMEKNTKVYNEEELEKEYSKYQKILQRWRCVVCKSNLSNIFFKECYHLSCCSKCLEEKIVKDEKGVKCPKCKNYSSDALTAYIFG